MTRDKDETADARLQRTGGLRSARSWLMPASAPVAPKRKAIALAIAGAADLLQLVVFPAFVEGALSPFEDVLDVVVAIAIVATLGFRWRLVFAFAMELVPGADLFPTWTAVVLSVPSAPSVEATSEPERAKG